MRLVTPCPNDPSCPGALLTRAVLLGLIYLSVGGGVALGLIGVALTLANPRGVGWGLGILVVGAVLFLVFVWPTPYKYYRASDHQLIRIHRVTGALELRALIPGRLEAVAASAPQSCRPSRLKDVDRPCRMVRAREGLARRPPAWTRPIPRDGSAPTSGQHVRGRAATSSARS
jgi:hypothetical protein